MMPLILKTCKTSREKNWFHSLKPENLTALVLDVKYGKAVFATTEDIAQALTQSLLGICSRLGIKAVALITSMDTPLGNNVGNSVEVAEAISCLNGKGPQDLKELVCKEGTTYLIPYCDTL